MCLPVLFVILKSKRVLKEHATKFVSLMEWLQHCIENVPQHLLQRGLKIFPRDLALFQQLGLKLRTNSCRQCASVGLLKVKRKRGRGKAQEQTVDVWGGVASFCVFWLTDCCVNMQNALMWNTNCFGVALTHDSHSW